MVLSHNAGFTLPLNIGELGCNSTELNFSDCSLTGPRTRSERFIFRVDEFHFFAGQLPKELGKRVNLTYFNVAGNELQGGLSTGC